MEKDKIPKNLPAFLKDQQGSAVLLIALLLPIFLGFTALAVDVGHMMAVKAELQRTADGAVLAGVKGLVPYTGTANNQTPNWLQAQTQAQTMIPREDNNVNIVDGDIKNTITENISYGYWLLNPPTGYVQTLPTARSTTAAYLPEPAITVTLSRNVTMYFASLILISSPQTVNASAIAILPEAYETSQLPPVAVSWDTVYNIVGGAVQIDVLEQDIKPQSNKGIAGWFNLNGGNSVPAVKIDVPLISDPSGIGTGSKIYLVPGTKATLTDYITAGQTIVMPIVQDVSQKALLPITGWAAFKVDSLSANSMTGHFDKTYVISKATGFALSGYSPTNHYLLIN